MVLSEALRHHQPEQSGKSFEILVNEHELIDRDNEQTQPSSVHHLVLLRVSEIQAYQSNRRITWTTVPVLGVIGAALFFLAEQERRRYQAERENDGEATGKNE